MSGGQGNFLSLSRVVDFLGRFRREFWAFYAAVFCMDLGYGLFVFLFNLYLTDLHFDERAIGQILACFTLGNVVGTIPAMSITRRWGLRPLLLIAFGCVPVLLVLRVILLWWPAQLGLAFLSGAALCGWPICFSPALVALTEEKIRSVAFSMAFATGIGLGTLAGLAGGLVPELLAHSRFHLPLAGGIRIVLLLACAVIAIGALPIAKLRLEISPPPKELHHRLIHPYLLRFMPAFLLWTIVAGSFSIFSVIYLQKGLGIPLARTGAIFSASHLIQFGAVLAAPLLFQWKGLAKGVAVAQLATAVLLAALGLTRITPLAVTFYLLYCGTQYMCGPGIYNLLMSNVPADERNTASAVQNFIGALFQAGTAAITGICIVQLGYSHVLLANAALALTGAGLFFWLGIQTPAQHQERGSWISHADVTGLQDAEARE